MIRLKKREKKRLGGRGDRGDGEWNGDEGGSGMKWWRQRDVIKGLCYGGDV